jgi:hypothetical protein
MFQNVSGRMCKYGVTAMCDTPHSWHRAPKTLGINFLRNWSTMFEPLSAITEFMLMRQLRVDS